MTTYPRRYYCSDLERVGVHNTRFCCDSCHEDSDYGYPMVEVDLPGTEDYLAVCCRVELDDVDLTELRKKLEEGQ